MELVASTVFKLVWRIHLTRLGMESIAQQMEFAIFVSQQNNQG